MKKYLFISMITLVPLLFTSVENRALAQTFNLSGSDWYIREDASSMGEEMGFPTVSPSSWLHAQVPGNIQNDLQEDHVLRPQWWGPIDSSLYDVACKDWWYRKDFILTSEYIGKRLTLVFDGVDENCQIWLNGNKIGGNEGMFHRFWFDVTNYLKPGSMNKLAVKIEKMPKELLPYIINADGPNIPYEKYWFLYGIHKTRQILKELKTPGNFGWDWSTNLWTLGIWKNVKIEATGPARIEWTRVETTLSNEYKQANVHASLKIDCNLECEAQVQIKVEGHGAPVIKTFSSTLINGKNDVTADLQVNNPALWWPNGHGSQPLYRLSATIRSPKGDIIDSCSSRFGIRELRWIHTQGAPKDFPSRYQLIINGRPVRTIGSGIILPYITPGCGLQHELQLLRYAKAANMNFLRLNGGGGGPLFDDQWYDLADELGIMISYEYPIANAWNFQEWESDPEIVNNIGETSRNIIMQSRNHPSIVEYAGGNEMEPNEWNIASTKHPALNRMKTVVAEETDRLFRATCPDTGAKHSPWMFDIRSTYRHYDTIQTMRYGEFGSCSPAVWEVWKRDIPSKSRWPINFDDPILIHKNAVYAIRYKNMWSNKTDIIWAFAPDNLPDFIKAGQYLGAEGLRYAFDAIRRKGLRTGGMTNHCFSEPWPNAAGSGMIDFDGRTYMNYDFVKQAIAPISLSLQFDSVIYKSGQDIKTELFLTSDSPTYASGLRWQWIARDQDGHVFDNDSGTTAIAPLEVKSLAKLSLKPMGDADKGLIFVEMQLHDSAGNLLTERIQIFIPGTTRLAGLLAKNQKIIPEISDSIPVNPVKQTILQVKSFPIKSDDNNEIYKLAITNKGSMTALFCEPHPRIVYRTYLFIENNNCFVPPGETRIITIRTAKNADCGLSLAQTGWDITCWNADTISILPDSTVLMSIGRRDRMCQEFLGKNIWNTGHLVNSDNSINQTFICKRKSTVLLRVHTADQSRNISAEIEITINGKTFTSVLPKGLAVQDVNPEQLAFPYTAEFNLPLEVIKAGENKISIQVKGKGWFTLDAIDAISM